MSASPEQVSASQGRVLVSRGPVPVFLELRLVSRGPVLSLELEPGLASRGPGLVSLELELVSLELELGLASQELGLASQELGLASQELGLASRGLVLASLEPVPVSLAMTAASLATTAASLGSAAASLEPARLVSLDLELASLDLELASRGPVLLASRESGLASQASELASQERQPEPVFLEPALGSAPQESRPPCPVRPASPVMLAVVARHEAETQPSPVQQSSPVRLVPFRLLRAQVPSPSHARRQRQTSCGYCQSGLGTQAAWSGQESRRSMYRHRHPSSWSAWHHIQPSCSVRLGPT
jgi:hypothetical protein